MSSIRVGTEMIVPELERFQVRPKHRIPLVARPSLSTVRFRQYCDLLRTSYDSQVAADSIADNDDDGAMTIRLKM